MGFNSGFKGLIAAPHILWWSDLSCLTLKTVRPIYIGRVYRYPPDVALYIYIYIYIYIFSTDISTQYFKHAAHSPFFSSKCRLFNNATFLVHVLFTFTYRVC